MTRPQRHSQIVRAGLVRATATATMSSQVRSNEPSQTQALALSCRMLTIGSQSSLFTQPAMNALRIAALRNGVAATRQHLFAARGVQGSLIQAQSPRVFSQPLPLAVSNTLRAGAWLGLQQGLFHTPSVTLRASNDVDQAHS